MDFKTKPKVHVQSSISAFFQPKHQPKHSEPPSSLKTQSSIPVPPMSSYKLPPKAAASKPSPRPLHPQVTIALIEQQHIQPLRRINSLLLPIEYPDRFYNDILAAGSKYSRIILWTDPEPKVIGGVVCRLDPSLAPDHTLQNPVFIPGSFAIYVQSLGLLSPYRERGIASMALESVMKAAREEREYRVTELYAHVWTENLEALEWYGARGFTRDELPLVGYYHRLKPNTAWVVRKRLLPTLTLPEAPAPQIQAPILQPVELEPRERPQISHTASFQDRRPDMEWNDLPEDVLRNSLLRTSADVSAASSRSSSRSTGKGGKKKRQYPAAAMGPLGATPPQQYS